MSDSGLRLRDSGVLRAPWKTFHFIHWSIFELESAEAPTDVLEALIRHDSYALTFLPPDEPGTGWHGPYELSDLSVDLFEPRTPAAAKAEIREWIAAADDDDSDLSRRSQPFVNGLPDTGSAFRLPHLPDRAYEYNVLGHEHGFNEWVFIIGTVVVLIVATDD